MIAGGVIVDASCDLGWRCFAEALLIVSLELAAVALALWLVARGIRALLR